MLSESTFEFGRESDFEPTGIVIWFQLDEVEDPDIVDVVGTAGDTGQLREDILPRSAGAAEFTPDGLRLAFGHGSMF